MAQAERDAMAKRLVAAEMELSETKAALDGAKLAMKALNEKLVDVTAERDALSGAVAKTASACALCRHESWSLPCLEIKGAIECETCTLEKAICCTCEDGSSFEFGVKEAEAALAAETREKDWSMSA